MDFIWHYASPLGAVTLASDGTALTGLWFEGQKYYAETLGPEFAEHPLSVFDRAVEWLDIYFRGRDPGSPPPLSPSGTPFRLAVWEFLLTVPYGHTVTYGDIAKALSEKSARGHTSARAVGNAVGHNPLSLFIPCHRVVGAGGSLTGYAGGLERKRRLLLLEKAFPLNG
ncbi:MAG: methylated-DNA--[protein]-cysteine S-methyltransferase [Oscillospiraceae bacterium]|nr:methylated-DNA--[protein]-cysteine S-methyltransferase [Oscillospiraceae bacterium]